MAPESLVTIAFHSSMTSEQNLPNREFPLQQYTAQVDTTNALKELYIYAAKYNTQLLAALEDREGGTLGESSAHSLVNRLRMIESRYRAGTLKRFV